MFAIVMCLVLLICTLTICSSMLGVFMVEDMSRVVNVTVFLMTVMNPPPVLCNPTVHTVVKLGTLGVFALGVRLVSWTFACVL